MRIAYNNLIDAMSSASVVASSTATGYSVINVQDQRLSNKWKTDTATTQSVVVTCDNILPEYPDDPAGTTYINELSFDAVPSGFSVNGDGESSFSNGIWRMTAPTLGYGGYTVSIPAGKIVYITVRVISGSGFRYGITGSLLSTTSSSWITVSYYVPTNSTFYLVANLSPAVWEIATIYVGTGVTISPVLDNSGNGHHLTANALIPVVDATAPGGRYVKLSGQPSYMSGTLSGFTTALFLSFPFYLPAASTTAKVVAESSVDYTGQDGAWALIWNFGGTSGRLALVMRTASGEYLGGYCTPTASTWYYGAIQYNQADSAATALGLYLNGALQTLTSLYTGATRPAVYNGVHYFGARAGSSMFNDCRFAPDIRIYRRTLLQSEISNIYAGTSFITENDDLYAKYMLNTEYNVNTAAILGHNIKAGTTVKIQANSSDAWASPSVDQQFAYVASNETILHFFTSASVYKYWRFSFAGQGSLEIGRLWLGKYLTVSPSSLLDFTVTEKNDDTVVHGINRQKWASQGESWREFSFTFPKTDESMLYELNTMYDTVGMHSCLIFANFDSLLEYEMVMPCYASITGPMQFSHTERFGMQYAITMEEQK